jgi:hypothetical protein
LCPFATQNLKYTRLRSLRRAGYDILKMSSNWHKIEIYWKMIWGDITKILRWSLWNLVTILVVSEMKSTACDKQKSKHPFVRKCTTFVGYARHMRGICAGFHVRCVWDSRVTHASCLPQTRHIYQYVYIFNLAKAILLCFLFFSFLEGNSCR